jgi:hypothetical protein
MCKTRIDVGKEDEKSDDGDRKLDDDRSSGDKEEDLIVDEREILLHP